MNDETMGDKTMTEMRKILREGYASLGVDITDEQLDHWEYLKTATISGKGSTDVTVSADLMFALYSILNQLLDEMATEETSTGQLPFDGSCACPKHSLMLPAFNEITNILNEQTVGNDDLSGEFKVTLDLMAKKQQKILMDASERIGVSKEDPYKSDKKEGE